ncbi:phosphoketolase [Trichophyton equinum CBS 127.97]|uniref:Phosphoketolase n=1 Tax=Trichophyton equinum (strain ATCC MYA-4606 / CBS 127.97) TaxID=559882 RepID=F2PKE2_TRIEC|nr:phosphoketolase [Trichophyton equinum CBS 127.97]
MPGEIIDRPNPGPPPSQLPDSVDELRVQLQTVKLDDGVRRSLEKFRRATDYIAAAMIFLQSNAYMKRPVKPEDIKPRLLGHWGTCPGLNLVYSHLTYLIRCHDLDMLFVTGPGHGAPAILASLWVEGSLGKFYPKYANDTNGLTKLITQFSTTGGFPSHINAETPGAIHEGGELGYALAVSFGSVMDNPDLITAVVVGDGEAESGPCTASWNGIKYIDPAESGAVLPILHLNGFKISERTIYGCMDDRELVSLFSGFGYQARIVEGLDDIDTNLNSSLEWALAEIRRIQKAARSGSPIMKPRWPMLILRTPKGWTGPKSIHGEIVEGSFAAHQVPLPAAGKDDEELKALQEWLSSYKPEELFTEHGDVVDDIKSILPKEDSKRMGQRKEVCDTFAKLKMPDWRRYTVSKGSQESSMKTISHFMGQILVDNPHSMRIFSPDELESNKLGAVLEKTGRNFQCDQFSNAQGGRVIEVLSEHMCQGFLQGYTLTGRTGVFPSYESFLGIIHTMMVQYSKFNKMGMETNWRRPLPSINYIETSTWARQEHNGFSHQNPSFISAVLNLKPNAARNYVNLMIGSKQPTQIYLSAEEAETHCRAGGSTWGFASTDGGLDPDVVLVGIGTEVTFEVIQAAAILRKVVPDLRVRVVNVTDLMILGSERSHPHSLSDETFDALFTADRPIHFNYHGYETELKGLLFGRPRVDRITIGCYMEEGSTTTPFDMMLLNRVSRFHVAKAAVLGGSRRNEKVRIRQQELLTAFEHEIRSARKYIIENHKGKPSYLYSCLDILRGSRSTDETA